MATWYEHLYQVVCPIGSKASRADALQQYAWQGVVAAVDAGSVCCHLCVHDIGCSLYVPVGANSDDGAVDACRQ